MKRDSDISKAPRGIQSGNKSVAFSIHKVGSCEFYLLQLT